MQKAIDSKIQAQVRILLAKRWVDLRALTVGTTNGVVYIGGQLRPSGGQTSGPDRPAGWEGRLRREIARIPEVRDVIFQQREQPSGSEPAGGAAS